MTICIQRAQGVPGVFSQQPPHWAAFPASSPLPFPVWPGLDDPRWRGAVSIAYGSGTSGDARFRALYHEHGGQRSLYFSWRVYYDPTLSDDSRLMVGFVPAAGDPIVFNIDPYDSIGSDLTASEVTDIITQRFDGTNWAAAADNPDWLTDLNVHSWLTVDLNEWVIQMRVPVHTNEDLGVNLADTFDMWYSLKVVVSTGAPVNFNWPRSADPTGLTMDTPPLPSDWDSFHCSTGPADPSCPTTGGVSIAYSDVGTTNTPSSKILYGAGQVNTIYAQPTNESGNPITAGELEGTFRIANWGSTISDPTASWDVIRSGVGNSNTIADGTKANSGNDIRFDWTVPSDMVDDFNDGTKREHQCMLVELSSTTNLTFLNDSVYRNMDFDTASRLERSGQISVVGLAPLAEQPHRDVYLAVQTLNMPPVILPDDKPGDDVGEEKRSEQMMRRSSLEEAFVSGQVPDAYFDRILATYRMHVYHDTGKTMEQDGISYPILHVQNSFGYYILHEGPNYGWTHILQGEDAVLQLLAPNFYRVGVPHGGVVNIKTTIQALETPGCRYALAIAWRSFLEWLRGITGG